MEKNMNKSVMLAAVTLLGIPAGAVVAQSAGSQQIISMYMAKAQPVLDKAQVDVANKIAEVQDPAKKAKLQAIFKDGVLTADDKAFIIQSLALQLDRYMTPQEAAQTAAFLQSPAGKHFEQAQADISKSVKPLINQLVQKKLATLQGL
jgi:plasmid maintenance system killer protein